jgi:hypothetical protein
MDMVVRFSRGPARRLAQSTNYLRRFRANISCFNRRDPTYYGRRVYPAASAWWIHLRFGAADISERCEAPSVVTMQSAQRKAALAAVSPLSEASTRTRSDEGRRRIATISLSPRVSLRRAKTACPEPTPANSIDL